MDEQIFSALIPDASGTTRAQIAKTLRAFGEPALRFAAERGTQVRPLGRGERYTEASPALARLGIDVDAWPAPPAGLFVVEERTVYARSRSAMTVAHEFGHALDCALGDGVYLSGIDSAPSGLRRGAAVRDALRGQRARQYFAECVRAWVEASDPASVWPPVSRERLHRLDPAMRAIIKGIFDGLS